MERLRTDLVYAFRTFAKNPGFASAAVLSLALGIGANTTIFSLINALFLNPLPVKRPGELVALQTVDEKNPGASTVSYPNYKDFRDRNEVFRGLAAYSFPNLVSMLAGNDEPEQAFVEFVTGNYFDVLGLEPALGRFFLSEEDETPGSHPVVVLGHGLWSRRFGSDPAVLGSIIRLNGRPFTVVGVGPDGYKGVSVIFGPDVWVPAMMQEQLAAAQFRDFFNDRRALFFNVFGRLRDGTSLESASANVAVIADALAEAYPEPNRGRSAKTVPLAEATLFPGGRNAMLLGGVVLMTVVGLVLLIACSNVANLMLAKSVARQKEIAIRLSMGASRLRLVRQLMTESTILGLLGGLVGLIVAYMGRNFIWSFRPAFVANNMIQPTLDSRVFLFALLLSLATGLVFGLAPALQASRFSVVDTLKNESRAVGSERRRISLRNGLVVVQVALSIVSLIAAGLFLRSSMHAHEIDPGFETRRLGVMIVNPGQGGYSQERAEHFYDAVLERVRALPGLRSASWASNLPLFGGFSRSIFPEGQENQDRQEGVLVPTNVVDVDFFETFDVAVVRGRDFGSGDRKDSVPVAVINEKMAQQFWPGEEALGKRFRMYGNEFFQEVVGVVETTRIATLGEEPQPCVYLPVEQNFADSLTLYLRTEDDPAPVMAAAQREIRAMDPLVPIINPMTVGEVIDQSLFAPKLAAGLLGVMGAIALALASVGLYGVLSFRVAQRSQEIGLRMALGARRQDVLRMVLANAMTVVGVGVAIGLAAAFAVSRAVVSLLYGISATDPTTFLGVTVVLTLVALVASSLPALRASRVDPLAALRYQ
ncbi:MAG TPA: ABC transporter permease [Vicinamibacteria bacterium]|nr:ABC transporter permease [Vicinamibacteria bacterium]